MIRAPPRRCFEAHDYIYGQVHTERTHDAYTIVNTDLCGLYSSRFKHEHYGHVRIYIDSTLDAQLISPIHSFGVIRAQSRTLLYFILYTDGADAPCRLRVKFQGASRARQGLVPVGVFSSAQKYMVLT